MFFGEKTMVETSKIDWASIKRDHVRWLAEQIKNLKVALYFPGHTSKDLKGALAKGIIDKKTFLIIVEGDKNLTQRKKNLKSIKTFLTKNKLTNVYIHRSRVHTLHLDRILNGRKIQLLFFDICGNYTSEIANWFHKYQECFAHNMRLPMTLAIHPRGKRKNKDTVEFFRAVKKAAPATLRDLGLHNVNNSLLDSEGMSNTVLSDTIMALKAIYYSFSQRVVNVKWIGPYRFNRTNMMSLDIRIGGAKEEDTTFEDIALVYDKKVCPAKQLRKTRKTRKTYTRKPILLKNANDIARHMGIYGSVESIYDMPRAKQSWISINANSINLDPDKVKTKIEKRLQKYGLKA